MGYVVATPQGNREVRAASGSVEWGPTTAPPPPSGWGGGTVTTSAALQIAAVYGCVGLLTSSVATAPLRLVDSDIPSRAKQLPLSPLMTQPYAEISRLEWIVQFVASLALRGNFYGQIIARDSELYAEQVKPISPDEVQVHRDRGTGKLEYKFSGKKVPLDDVVHVKMISLPGMLKGVNPIEALRLTFGLSIETTRYGESFFRNSAFPSGVIETDAKYDQVETEAIVKNWVSAHQGTQNANLPAMLTGGAKFKAITISPEDSQFLEARGFSAVEISGTIFRIPPHMVGLVDKTTSWGRGVEQQELGYTRNTLQDYTGRFEEMMTALHPPKQYAIVDLSHRLRGDTLERSQAGSLQMLAGLAIADEIRAELFDRPALPNGEGKKPFVPINTELLERALEEIAEAKASREAPEPIEPEVAPAKGGSA